MRGSPTLVLLVCLGCTSDTPIESCTADIDSLSELDGARRHGCLDPAVVPSWAAVTHLEDTATLGELVAPFDVGEGRWLKFVLERTAEPRWPYFINNAVFGPHWEFTRAIGCESDVHEHRVLGEIGYFADQLDEMGRPGRLYFSIDGNPPADFERVADTYEVLRERIPFAAGLTYRPGDETQVEAYEAERALYESAPFETVLNPSSAPDDGIAALNDGVTYGYLRRMSLGEVPGPTDLPVYPTLPNDLPMVAGIISTTPQTGLAHVNLRAVQDDVPNVYIPPALATTLVDPWLDSWVRMEVDGLFFELREATESEVNRHFEDKRPAQRQRPRLEISDTTIRPFSEIGFADAPAFGVKSANLAELHRLGLESVIPDGVAVPLSFYVRFMEETGLDEVVDDMLNDSRFRDERSYRDGQLAELRDRIEGATMPLELSDALADAYARWPTGTSLRCRSSTNAEDLADFNGAGLYESYTHHPEEGRLEKSIQQVYASLWTHRAYDQRQFNRVDHRRVAMGVTIHPNFEDEQVNGVATSDDVLYRWRDDIFYVNAQVGEDLVTNPEAGSVPEELYLTPGNPRMPYFLIRTSSLSDGELLMSDAELAMLARDLRAIHDHFSTVYPPAERFSMEVEFKITVDRQLAIKQARPWVYGSQRDSGCR